jgi:hypothetical protein
LVGIGTPFRVWIKIGRTFLPREDFFFGFSGAHVQVSILRQLPEKSMPIIYFFVNILESLCSDLEENSDEASTS